MIGKKLLQEQKKAKDRVLQYLKEIGKGKGQTELYRFGNVAAEA